MSVSPTPAPSNLGGSTQKDRTRDLITAILNMDDVVHRLQDLLDRMTGANCQVEKAVPTDTPPEVSIESFRSLMDHGPTRIHGQADELHKLIECLQQEIF